MRAGKYLCKVTIPGLLVLGVIAGGMIADFGGAWRPWWVKDGSKLAARLSLSDGSISRKTFSNSVLNIRVHCGTLGSLPVVGWRCTMNPENVSPEAAEHFDRGLELLDGEAYQDAAAEFLLAIRANAPEPFVRAERMLASAYRDAISSHDDLERTVDQYKKVTSLDPSDAGSWLWQALLMDNAALDFQIAGFRSREARGRQQIDLALKGRQGRKFEKEAKKAFTKAEQTFPRLTPGDTEPLKMGESILAAYAAGTYFTEMESPDNVRKGVEWLSRTVEMANTMAARVQEGTHNAILDFSGIAEQARREQVLAEENLAQLEKKDKKARNVKVITWGVVLAILMCLCSAFLLFAT